MPMTITLTPTANPYEVYSSAGTRLGELVAFTDKSVKHQAKRRWGLGVTVARASRAEANKP